MNRPDFFSKNGNYLLGMTNAIYNKYDNKLIWNNDTECVMDIGVGDGSVAQQIIIPRLPKNFKEFIGIDLSEAAVKYAKKIIDLPNTKMILMNISTKDSPAEYKNRFDHIFSNRCLHHVENLK